jgi:hypothetical protein
MSSQIIVSAKAKNWKARSCLFELRLALPFDHYLSPRTCWPGQTDRYCLIRLARIHFALICKFSASVVVNRASTCKTLHMAHVCSAVASPHAIVGVKQQIMRCRSHLYQTSMQTNHPTIGIEYVQICDDREAGTSQCTLRRTMLSLSSPNTIYWLVDLEYCQTVCSPLVSIGQQKSLLRRLNSSSSGE